YPSTRRDSRDLFRGTRDLVLGYCGVLRRMDVRGHDGRRPHRPFGIRHDRTQCRDLLRLHSRCLADDVAAGTLWRPPDVSPGRVPPHSQGGRIHLPYPVAPPSGHPHEASANPPVARHYVAPGIPGRATAAADVVPDPHDPTGVAGTVAQPPLLLAA